MHQTGVGKIRKIEDNARSNHIDVRCESSSNFLNNLLSVMINFALEEMTPILAISPVSRHVEVGQVTSWQTSPTSGGIEWESIDPCNQHSFGVTVTLIRS